ncbi:hypothetical protein [Leifsonia sp. 22587]|uniref:hypothetical protein n=1 Tax=Leifsonia sp. 22587 TaxID=3453946 RepID=UPI003F83CBA9
MEQTTVYDLAIKRLEGDRNGVNNVVRAASSEGAGELLALMLLEQYSTALIREFKTPAAAIDYVRTQAATIETMGIGEQPERE